MIFGYRIQAVFALCLSLTSGYAAAETPILTAAEESNDTPILAATIPEKTGGAGLGVAMRMENSPYRGGGTRYDLVPIYMYQSEHVFLESYRAGLKFNFTPDSRLDLYAGYRFEGYPYERIPVILSGMNNRGPGIDVGMSYQSREQWGTLFGEVLHDASSLSNGTEVRAGYRYDGTVGRLQLQPQLSLAARDANLNNYYYGVRAAEATATRPAYMPGSGINSELGLSAVYRLSERWRLLSGVSAKRWSQGVRASPVVQDRTQLTGQLGLAYDFSPKQEAFPEGRPLIVKVLYGKSTDCDLAKLMQLRCASINTADQTRITSIELGRPFIERLNDWPLDFVGYLGALRHDERGLQADSWQFNAYMKAYYYGFPWSERVRTRLGFGAGISYAGQIPYVEMRSQVARGRSSSKLLNYLDPSIDVSVGDIIGAKSMRETYVGLGVSHRSGIFGTSRLFGNVNGGSNYIYSYLEWQM